MEDPVRPASVERTIDALIEQAHAGSSHRARDARGRAAGAGEGRRRDGRARPDLRGRPRPRLHAWPAAFALPSEAEMLERTGPERRERLSLPVSGGTLVAQPLDVAGEWFGQAALLLPAGADVAAAAPILDCVCEELDGYLFGVRAAREKHRLVMRLGEALRHRVLGEGLHRAVAVLAEAVPFARLLLACVPEEDAERASCRTCSSSTAPGRRSTPWAARRRCRPRRPRRGARRRPGSSGDGAALLGRFGFSGAHEELLISGVTQAVVVGKLVAASARGAFNTYDRELLSAFASFIRQRVVDFGREWRALAESFRAEDVTRLLQVGRLRAALPRAARGRGGDRLRGHLGLHAHLRGGAAGAGRRRRARGGLEPRRGRPRVAARRRLRQDGRRLRDRALRAALLRDAARRAPARRPALRGGHPRHDAAAAAAAGPRTAAGDRARRLDRRQPVPAVRGHLRAEPATSPGSRAG